jgi:hypothetical protein
MRMAQIYYPERLNSQIYGMNYVNKLLLSLLFLWYYSIGIGDESRPVNKLVGILDG